MEQLKGLNELKKKIISILLAMETMMALSSCNTRKPKVGNIPITTTYEVTTEDEFITSDIEAFYEHVDISSFLKRIDSIKSHYDYEEYYPSLDDSIEYKRIAKTITSCPEEDLSYDELADIITQNTINKYGNNNGIFFDYSCYYSYERLEELSDKTWTIVTALNQAIRKIFKNATNDISEDICKLKDICITDKDLSHSENSESSSSVLAMWDKDNKTIIIDYERIKAEYEKYNSEHDIIISFSDYLIQTIEHELNHVRQDICDHRDSSGQENKDIYAYEGLSFLMESSAESELYALEPGYRLRYLDSSHYTYYAERQNENYLLLIAAFNDSRKIDQYYNAIFDSDLNALYDFFGLETDEDFLSFNRVLYAFETLNARTELAKDFAGEEGKISHGTLDRLVGNNYRQDLFKLSIKNLIKAIERDNLSLDESLVLYNFVKAYTLDGMHVFENSEERTPDKVYGESLREVITSVEDIFMNYLEERTFVSVFDIRQKLKSTDIYISSKKLFDYLDDSYSDNYSYIGTHDLVFPSTIVEKYPIITNMLFTSRCYYFFIDNFDEYVEEVSSKKLVLTPNNKE